LLVLVPLAGAAVAFTLPREASIAAIESPDRS
jgi:hypothetical protein